MRYFIDTEFIEGFTKPLFGKNRHFIDLISIAIVAEDGRSYYAISNEYNYNDADDWVKENVIIPLYTHSLSGDVKNSYSASNFQYLVGKPNNKIANEIYQFICPYSKASEYAGVGSIDSGAEGYLLTNPPEFYGYYCDYDWVLFCSLFGRMIDLPKGFPMYCNDLKQILDEKAKAYSDNWMSGDEDFETRLSYIKSKSNYPKQENEHDALSDAKWNKKLYEFLTTGLNGR